MSNQMIQALAYAVDNSSTGGLVASWVMYTPPSATEAMSEDTAEPTLEEDPDALESAEVNKEKKSVLIFYASSREQFLVDMDD